MAIASGASLRLVFFSIVSALAGFLFGFDTVVISGAEKTIQRLWGLDDLWHGIVTGSALYGTVAGSLVGGWLTDRFGRRRVLLSIGAMYVLSAVGCSLAPGVATFVAARLLGGLGIGISTVVSPLYIAEIAPPAWRGRLAGMFQFNIVFGIVAAFLSNAALAGLGEDAWRWMIGVAAVPSLAYAVLCLWLPESPRWLLLRRGDRAAGLAVLRQIEPEADPRRLAEQADGIIAAAAVRGADGRFWSRGLRRPILLAVLIAVFNQLSGINAVLYFAPRIFEWTGMGHQSAMLQSVGIGVTNLVFTFVGLALIDRVGRRTLMYLGSAGYLASLGLTAWAFFSGHAAIVPVCLFAFIAAHAIGQGTVIWVFIAEIFPDGHRAQGQTLGSATHWVSAALLTTVFPIAVGGIESSATAGDRTPFGYIFLFFCGMMALQLLWVRFVMPETRGVPLERMQERLAGHG